MGGSGLDGARRMCGLDEADLLDGLEIGEHRAEGALEVAGGGEDLGDGDRRVHGAVPSTVAISSGVRP